jgi:hypothetical protein
MDADDISLPQRLETQLKFLKSNPGVILVGCGTFIADETGNILVKMDVPTSVDQIIQRLNAGASPFVHGSVLYQKESVINAGLYDKNMVTMEDWELWRRMYHQGRMVNLDTTLYKYRLTPGSITTLPRKQQRIRKIIIDKILKNGTCTDQDNLTLSTLKKNTRLSQLRAYYFLRAGKTLLEDEWYPYQARKYFVQGLREDILNWNCFFNLLLSFFPIHLVKIWKNGRLKKVGTSVSY